jgi:hypothetical protein
MTRSFSFLVEDGTNDLYLVDRDETGSIYRKWGPVPLLGSDLGGEVPSMGGSSGALGPTHRQKPGWLLEDVRVAGMAVAATSAGTLALSASVSLSVAEVAAAASGTLDLTA